MKHGQTIPKSKEDENLVTKTMGVLQENGPYAMFLFLEDKKKKDSTFVNKCNGAFVELITENEIGNFIGSPPKNASLQNMTEWLIEVSTDIDKLIFIKNIMEKTLLYARYYAKALSKPGEER